MQKRLIILAFSFVSILVNGARGQEMEYPALKAAMQELQKKLESVWALEAKAVAEAEAARIAEVEAMSAAVSAAEAEKATAAMVKLIAAVKERAELRLKVAEEMKRAYEAAVKAASESIKSGELVLEQSKTNLNKLKEEVAAIKLELSGKEKEIAELKKQGSDWLEVARASLERGDTKAAETYAKEAQRIAKLIKDAEKSRDAKRIVAEEAEKRAELGEKLVKAAESRLLSLQQLYQSIVNRYNNEVKAAELAAKEVDSLKESYTAAEAKLKASLAARRAAYAFFKEKAEASKQAALNAQAKVEIAKAEEKQLRLSLQQLQEEYRRAIEAIQEAQKLLSR
jgi:hypothetical protein